MSHHRPGESGERGLSQGHDDKSRQSQQNAQQTGGVFSPPNFLATPVMVAPFAAAAIQNFVSQTLNQQQQRPPSFVPPFLEGKTGAGMFQLPQFPQFHPSSLGAPFTTPLIGLPAAQVQNQTGRSLSSSHGSPGPSIVTTKSASQPSHGTTVIVRPPPQQNVSSSTSNSTNSASSGGVQTIKPPTSKTQQPPASDAKSSGMVQIIKSGSSHHGQPQQQGQQKSQSADLSAVTKRSSGADVPPLILSSTNAMQQASSGLSTGKSQPSGQTTQHQQQHQQQPRIIMQESARPAATSNVRQQGQQQPSAPQRSASQNPSAAHTSAAAAGIPVVKVSTAEQMIRQQQPSLYHMQHQQQQQQAAANYLAAAAAVRPLTASQILAASGRPLQVAPPSWAAGLMGGQAFGVSSAIRGAMVSSSSSQQQQMDSDMLGAGNRPGILRKREQPGPTTVTTFVGSPRKILRIPSAHIVQSQAEANYLETLQQQHVVVSSDNIVVRVEGLSSAQPPDQPSARKKPRKQLLQLRGEEPLVASFDPTAAATTSTVRQEKPATQSQPTPTSTVQSTHVHAPSHHPRNHAPKPPRVKSSEAGATVVPVPVDPVDEEEKKFQALFSGQISEYIDSSGVRWFSLYAKGKQKKGKETKRSRHSSGNKAGRQALNLGDPVSQLLRTRRSSYPRLNHTSSRPSWKPRYNHFERYEQVKLAPGCDENHLTLSAICHEAQSSWSAACDASGWRIENVIQQLERQLTSETELMQRIARAAESAHAVLMQHRGTAASAVSGRRQSTSSADAAVKSNADDASSSSMAPPPSSANRRGRGSAARAPNLRTTRQQVAKAAEQQQIKSGKHAQTSLDIIPKAEPFDLANLPKMANDVPIGLKSVIEKLERMMTTYVPVAQRLLARYGTENKLLPWTQRSTAFPARKKKHRHHHRHHQHQKLEEIAPAATIKQESLDEVAAVALQSVAEVVDPVKMEVENSCDAASIEPLATTTTTTTLSQEEAEAAVSIAALTETVAAT